MSTDTTALPDFGQAASDYVPAAFDEDDIWILKFPKGETLVRICPAETVNERGQKVFGTSAWPTEREHYDEDLKSAYPCAERFGIPCVGCQHANKKVRDRSRAYYINVLDADGKNRIYKMGVKLYKIFQGREQRALGRPGYTGTQPLSERDFIVIRTGSNMNDTSYDPEPGDAYEMDWPEEIHDIKAILKSKYAAAVAFYSGGGGEPQDDEPTPAPAARATTRIAPPKEEVPAEPAEEPDPIWFTNPKPDDLEDATSEELKKFLDRREVEYPPRAPRARLLAIAKKTLEPPF